MSVWFKYPSDKDITPGHPSGSSVFAPVSGGGGYPAYGTVLSTAYGVDYENGATAYSGILANSVYTEICDVDTKADGVGGSYVDWANATNIQYKAAGTFIATSTEDIAGNSTDVPVSSGNYYAYGSYSDRNEVHSGAGGIDTVGAGTFTYYPNGTYIAYAYDSTSYVPSSSVNPFSNGSYSNYVWDGTGGYTTAGAGSYYTNGTEVDGGLRYTTSNEQTEVPSGSGANYDNGKYNQDTYYWDGSGGSYASTLAGNPQGSYFPFGQFITDQNCPAIGTSSVGLGYYWDGYNGWFTAGYP